MTTVVHVIVVFAILFILSLLGEGYADIKYPYERHSTAWMLAKYSIVIPIGVVIIVILWLANR